MKERPMAKATVPNFSVPAFKFPKFDLDSLFATQTANLAAVHEAQRVVTDAAQAIAKVQYAYVEQTVTEAKAAMAVKELPKPEAMLANAKTGAEKTIATAKEVVGLAVAAQQRAYTVLRERGQSSVDELKAVAA
jgi:hypothetical protein